MVKTILVPTDFSENAKAAFRYARAIAQQFDCRIYLAHAYLPFHSGFQSKNANEKMETDAEEEATTNMTTFISDCWSGATESGVHTILTKSNLVDALSGWISESQADLIVMGTNGASGLGARVIGSHTFHVAKASTIPVLAVPETTRNFKLEHIAFFTDYREEDVTTLGYLKNLFGRVGSKCKVVHIYEPDDEPSDADRSKLGQWAEHLREQVGFKNLSWEIVYGEESAAMVEAVSDRHDADLLVLTLTDKGFLERLLEKSLARAIIHQAGTPILLVGPDIM